MSWFHRAYGHIFIILCRLSKCTSCTILSTGSYILLSFFNHIAVTLWEQFLRDCSQLEFWQAKQSSFSKGLGRHCPNSFPIRLTVNFYLFSSGRVSQSYHHLHIPLCIRQRILSSLLNRYLLNDQSQQWSVAK